MEKTEILARVDHTALKSTATWEDIRLLCEEAVEYKTASVCIPPSYLKRARAAFPQLNLCTVIGFPLGYSTTASKVKRKTPLHTVQMRSTWWLIWAM